MYNLFLDDERNPSDVTWKNIPRDRPYDIVRNYQQFVDHVTLYGVPDFVTFDHDLADEHYVHMLKDCQENSTGQMMFEVADPTTLFVEDDEGGLNLTFNYGPEKTGYDCAKWLVDYCIDRGIVFPPHEVHSMNPVGAARIHYYIENAKKHAGV